MPKSFNGKAGARGLAGPPPSGQLLGGIGQQLVVEPTARGEARDWHRRSLAQRRAECLGRAQHRVARAAGPGRDGRSHRRAAGRCRRVGARGARPGDRRLRLRLVILQVFLDVELAHALEHRLAALTQTDRHADALEHLQPAGHRHPGLQLAPRHRRAPVGERIEEAVQLLRRRHSLAEALHGRLEQDRVGLEQPVGQGLQRGVGVGAGDREHQRRRHDRIAGDAKEAEQTAEAIAVEQVRLAQSRAKCLERLATLGHGAADTDQAVDHGPRVTLG